MAVNIVPPLVLGAALLLAGCGGTGRLAPAGGPLRPCPSTPNCVTTEAADARHSMPPIPYPGTAEAAQARARAALLAEPRTRIVTERPGYLHAEARSRLFRFVDDVEVIVDGGFIRFRSASRVGRSDLGVNRARMERFSARFRAAQTARAVARRSSARRSGIGRSDRGRGCDVTLSACADKKKPPRPDTGSAAAVCPCDVGCYCRRVVIRMTPLAARVP